MLLALVFLVAFTVISSLLYIRFSYPFGGDLSFTKNTLGNLYDTFFIWQTNNYSGLISQGLSNSISVFYSVLFVVFISLGINGIKYSTALDFVILRLSGSLGMFFFVYYISCIRDIRIKIFSATFSAMIFIAPLGDFGGIYTAWVFLPIAVLSFYIFQRSIISLRTDYFWVAFAILSLSFEYLLLGNSGIIQGLILVFIIMIAMVISGNRKTVIKQITMGMWVILLSILIIFPSIYGAVVSTNVLKMQTALFSANSYTDFVNYANNIIQSFTYTLPFNFGISLEVLLRVVTFLVSVFAVFSVLLFINSFKTKKRITNIALTLGLVFAFISYIALSASIHKPFGELFSVLYEMIPYFVVFRYGSASFNEIFFILSALLGIGISYLLSVTVKNKLLFSVSIIIILLFFAFFSYFNTFLPIVTNGVPWTNHLLPFISTIPKHVTDIAGYINSNVSGYAVATLPSDADWHISKWYNGTDIYSSIINAPVYTGGFTAYSEFFFPPTQRQYAIIAQLIQDTNSSMNISEALGVFGIKYIIVQGDTANIPFGPNHPLNSYKFSDIYHNLNSSSGIRFVKRFANSSIYINERAVPLVYPSDLIVSNDNNTGQIINLIADNGINVSRYSVYSDNVIGGILWYGDIPLFNSSNTINATQVNDFSDPGIRFVQNTPTKITVDVSNATTPYYLVFRETYDTHWVAYYSNGTAVPERDHIMVNGFANAWYIDRPGSYTITLYYTLQTEAWIAWVISFAALFATVGIGIYGWRARGAPIQKRARVRKRG